MANQIQKKAQLGPAVVAIACISASLLTQKAWAWPPLYGPEFTFTDDTLINLKVDNQYYDTYERYLRSIADEYRKKCLARASTPFTCTVHPPDVYGSFEITYSNGFSVNVDLDPGVIEVQATPSSLQDIKKMAPILEEDLFGSMRKSGLTPNRHYGGGHISISLDEAFRKNPLLLRNFVVDYFNHSELSEGIFTNDINNSLSFPRLKEQSRKKIREVIDYFDLGMFKDADEFILTLEDAHFDFHKTRALNMSRMISGPGSYPVEFRRGEVRAFPAQNSMSDYVKEVELLERRMLFLEAQGKPIPLAQNFPTTPAEKVQNFYRYVQESGLPWDSYKSFLTPEYEIARPTLPKINPLSAAEFKKAQERLQAISAAPMTSPTSGCARLFSRLKARLGF